MIKTIKIFIAIALFSLLNSCKSDQKIGQPIVLELNNSNSFKMELCPGKSFNHPTFVIWIEDMNENYLKTIFVTESYASGVYGYKMIGDSIWVKESGKSIQPAALPYWTNKKGLINNKSIMPTPENPFVDAFTGATPTSKFTLTDKAIEIPKYKLLVEVNQTWDWNDFWTNNKFPTCNAYKHSAQPSVVYSVTVNSIDSVYYLNPIGYGSPKGENGKLSTDLSSLTTALEIFSTIKLTIQN